VELILTAGRRSHLLRLILRSLQTSISLCGEEEQLIQVMMISNILSRRGMDAGIFVHCF
jgi:hypothetical protein